jgi:import inner membrane translocase subunit TIM44
MAKTLSSTGKSVSEAVNKAANEIEESRLIQTARRVTKELDRRIAEPIRQTEVYKVVEDTVDFSQGALRYGGYIEKEERIRRRQKRLDRLAKANPNSSIISAAKAPLQNSSSSSSSPSASASSSDAPPTTEESSSNTTVEGSQIAENPNAPPALVLHATANEEAQEDSRTIGSRMKGTLTGSGLREMWKNVQEGYAESENPVVASIRSVTGFLRRNLLDETETAKVIRLVKEVDPAFNYDAFLADLREFIIPDFVDSFVDNDLQALKMWTSEAVSIVLLINNDYCFFLER